jgi:hypothetical protein
MRDGALTKSLPPSVRDRPGRVEELRGVIFQSDAVSVFGAWIIRPVETLDMRLAGVGRSPNAPALAMHAGLHVVLEDRREFVVEQLFGTPREDFVDGLNWTPLETFRNRDHTGWDVTVPATAFRQVDENVVHQAVEYLNGVPGRPFFGEDCTMLIERAFSKRRLFADSPTARALGFGMRVGDPCVSATEARCAARCGCGTPFASGLSARIARSNDRVGLSKWSPVDSPRAGLDALHHSTGQPQLLY